MNACEKIELKKLGVRLTNECSFDDEEERKDYQDFVERTLRSIREWRTIPDTSDWYLVTFGNELGMVGMWNCETLTQARQSFNNGGSLCTWAELKRRGCAPIYWKK